MEHDLFPEQHPQQTAGPIDLELPHVRDVVDQYQVASSQQVD
jgi:hypothetical protein